MLKWQVIKVWCIQQRERWLNKRVPSSNSIRLNINNTFILPSSFGWSCIGIVICLFILGTNFQNNIILLLCYFLLAMILLAIFHSYFYFTQHKIAFLDIQADFENRQLFLPIEVTSRGDYKGGFILFNAHNAAAIIFQGNSLKEKVKVPLPAYSRGSHRCPKVTISSTYGFGLFKCWSQLSPKLRFYVYPSMQKSCITLEHTTNDAPLAHSSDTQYVISDDLQGIREYQLTDPMHHVSWKHVAKGQGMLTKDFTDAKGVSGWLKLSNFQHMDIEQALRCLCYQVQQLDKDQVQYGLDLGNTKILPHEGQAHLYECLRQLAIYKPLLVMQKTQASRTKTLEKPHAIAAKSIVENE